MKIGILGTRGVPNHYGGFEQFAEFLAPELVKRGHEVFVYNSHRHPYQQKDWNGVQLIHCKDPEHKLGTFGQFIYDLNCNKDAAKRNYDVLLHFGYSSDSVWWRQWPKNIINIVNMDGLEWKRTKYNWLTRKFLKRAESLAAKHAHTMIADSPAMQQYLFEAYKKKPVYIPYAATVFSEADPATLDQYNLKPFEYFLLIARMEPENNIEMVINGYLESGHRYPLFIIGNTDNKTGRYFSRKYKQSKIIFAGPVYDALLLNNLRHYSSLYFHGHSVGGTNPSLLEAMACGCNIAAHDNIFNKAVLQQEADFFSSSGEVAAIINKSKDQVIVDQNKSINIERIRTLYDPEKIINEYEKLLLSYCQ
jgi:glycosyltransferase involved in cell wall biosynthesis